MVRQCARTYPEQFGMLGSSIGAAAGTSPWLRYLQIRIVRQVVEKELAAARL